MTVLVQNLTNETKQICRFGGKKLYILPNNIITFECTNTSEVSYWSKQSIKNLSSYGIKVVVDIAKINYLTKLRNAGKLSATITNNNTISNDVGVESPEIIENNIISTNKDVNIVESTIEETVEPETTVDNVEDIVKTSIPVDATEDTVVKEVENSVETDVEYTEEYLSTLSKEELQNILINKDISFKKNNSVNTLISLILGE